MSNREAKTEITPELQDYMVDNGARQDDVLARVERETRELGASAKMQVSPDQGAMLELLVRSLRVTRALEVGTFTGYSAICIARGLEDGGSLLCLELDPGYAATARGNLEAAGLDGRAEIRVGPAGEALQALPEEEAYDFAFIDADKPGYPDYYELVLARLRPGGLLLIDNVLYGGDVLHPEGVGARAIDALNRRIAADERVDCAMVAVADGIMFVRKR
jgi:caffeoyl-CoA O-methyltransferase